MRAIRHPLLGHKTLERAKGVFVFIRFGKIEPDFKSQCEVMKIVMKHTVREPLILWNVALDPSLEEPMSVCILATKGLEPG